jgi:hypothetical protein
MKYIRTQQSGASLIEAMLAIGALALLSSALLGSLVYGPQASLAAGDRYRATLLVEEGLEATKHLHDNALNEMTVSLSGVDDSSGEWELLGEGSTETIGKYDRTITYADVCRDVSDALIDCADAGVDYIDPNMKNVAVDVAWTGQFGSAKTVSGEIQLSNWDSPHWVQTDWQGGDGQAEWSDETAYESDDGNLDVTTSGEVVLDSGSPNECGEFSWHFANTSGYTFDSAEIAIVNDQAELVSSTEGTLPFETGMISVDENFTTVNLENTYDTPVIVAMHEQANNTLPVSVRIQNAGSTSFEVRLQHANTTESSSVVADAVYYLVMEEGAGYIGDTLIEAHQHTTSSTGSLSGGWAGDSLTYDNVYSTAPTILHQAMTYNDAAWTTSFVRSPTSVSQPPTTTGFRIGLNTGESATTHGSETIGWIAIENTAGDTHDSFTFENDQTTDSVRGNGTSFIQNFSSSYPVTPIVIASMQEVDGNNGSWAVANDITAGDVDFFADEDTFNDSERSHTTETLGYLTTETGFASTVDPRTGFPTSVPSIEMSSYAPTAVARWSGFQEEASKDGTSEIYYQISPDDGTTWYWWDGVDWVAAIGATDYNTATEIDTNIADFSVDDGQLAVQAFLASGGSDQIHLDRVSVTCEQDQEWTFDDSADFTYDSADIEITGGEAQLLESGGVITDIFPAFAQEYEYDTTFGGDPDAIQIAGNIFAIVYENTSGQGELITIQIDDDGRINEIIDTLTYETSDSDMQKILAVDTDTYAIVYEGVANDGWISTVDIDSSGTISSVLDTLEYDTSHGQTPSPIMIDADTLAISYESSGSDLWMATVDVDSAGSLSFVDSHEFDSSTVADPSLAAVTGDVYAVAYRGNGNDGFLLTVEIDSAGAITTTALDSLEYDTTNGRTPSITMLDSDTAAIVYSGPGNDGWFQTIDIAASGTIAASATDSLEFDTLNLVEPDVYVIDSDTIAVAYQGNGNDGFLVTIDVDTAGTISGVVESTEFDELSGIENSIVQIDSDTLAVVYNGFSNHGVIQTFDFDSSGNLTYRLPQIEHDTNFAIDNDVLNHDEDTVLIAYRGTGNDGFISTVNTNADGSIESLVDTLEFDTSDGFDPAIVEVDSDTYAIAYRGPSNDGWLATVDIASDGTLSGVIDTLEFDTVSADTPSIVALDSDTFAIAYEGDADDGFVTTVDIDSSGGIAPAVTDTFEFETAQAEDTTMFVIDTDTVGIAYSGPNDDGFVSSIDIDTAGAITATVNDTLEFDTSSAYDPSVTFIDSDTIAIAYEGPAVDGWLATLDVDSSGVFSAVDTFEFDPSQGETPSITEVTGNDFIIVYTGPGDDGFADVINIQDDGTIAASVTASFEFDTTAAIDPDVTYASGYIAVGYSGSGTDGFLLLLEPEGAGSYPTDNPDVYPTAAFTVTDSGVSGWQSFTEDATKDGSAEITYQLSDDDGITWYWWDGNDWVEATGATDSNTAIDVDSAIGRFPTRADQLQFRAFFNSNGVDQATLDTITVGYTQYVGGEYHWPFDRDNNYSYAPTDITVGDGEADVTVVGTATIAPVASLSTPGVLSYDRFSADVVIGGGGSEVFYQLSDDDGVTWYYWDGDSWSIVSGSQYTSAATLNEHISDFTTTSEQILVNVIAESGSASDVQIQEMRMSYNDGGGSGLATFGELQSSAYDMGEIADVTVIDWDEEIPVCVPPQACDIQFQVRTAPDSAGVPDTANWTDWYGDTGSADYFDTDTGHMISVDLNGNQWLQYRVEITGDGNETPILEEVRISYQ